MLKELVLKAQELMSASKAGEEPGYRFNHGVRTAHLAARICKEEGLEGSVNHRVLFLSCLLHDLGKSGISENRDHAKIGAAKAALLLDGEVETYEREAIREAIFWHNKREEAPRDLSLEGHLLQDADLLDHFGALEVWILSYRVILDEGAIGDLSKAYRGASGWRRYALSNLRFSFSENEMRRRMRIGSRFIRALELEAVGGQTCD